MARLVNDESGATAVEYSLMIGGIAAAIVLVVYFLGGKANNLYDSAASQWP